MAASRSSTATPMWSIRANTEASLRKQARGQYPEAVLQALAVHPPVHHEVVDELRAQHRQQRVGHELGVLLRRGLRDEMREMGAIAAVDVGPHPAVARLHLDQQVAALDAEVDHRLAERDHALAWRRAGAERRIAADQLLLERDLGRVQQCMRERGPVAEAPEQ